MSTQVTSTQRSTVKAITPVRSAIYMKKLVAMSISHIIYLRGLMPEHVFEDREFEGVGVKILSEKSRYKPAMQITSWLKGAFEAFDRKYLEKLEFIFFNGEGEVVNVHESYAFHFTYHEGNITVNCENNSKKQSTVQVKMDDVRLCIVQLLHHTTLLLQTMKDFPVAVSMRVRLFYYDEVTPVDYEPPGFAKSPDTEYVFEKKPLRFKHGVVNTGHHSVTLSSKICKSSLRKEREQKSNEVEEAAEDQGSGAKGPSDIEMQCDPSSGPRSTAEKIQGRCSIDTIPESEATPTDVRHAPVHCACGNSYDEGLMVFCDFCRQWNHAVCYRLEDAKSVPSPFCCIFCHDSESGTTCDDPTLVSLPEDKRQILCLYRRALMFCMSAWRIDRQILMNELSIPENIADRILLFMDKDKLFFNRRRSKGSYLHTNSAILKNDLLPKYFIQGDVDLPDVDLPDVDLKNGDKPNPLPSSMSIEELPLSELLTLNRDNVRMDKSDMPVMKRLPSKNLSDEEDVKKPTKRKFFGQSKGSVEMEPRASLSNSSH